MVGEGAHWVVWGCWHMEVGGKSLGVSGTVGEVDPALVLPWWAQSGGVTGPGSHPMGVTGMGVPLVYTGLRQLNCSTHSSGSQACVWYGAPVYACVDRG